MYSPIMFVCFSALLVLFLPTPIQCLLKSGPPAPPTGKDLADLMMGCRDSEGIKRRNGEQWNLRDHFVMRCADMRIEVVACLREDARTQLAIGAEAKEANGLLTVLCRREGEGPSAPVRREYRLNAGRVSPAAGGGQSLPSDTFPFGRGCLGKQIGSRWRYRTFELECASPEVQPKLVACMPPELNGEKVAFGAKRRVGPFTVSCEQLADGSYAHRYIY